MATATIYVFENTVDRTDLYKLEEYYDDVHDFFVSKFGDPEEGTYPRSALEKDEDGYLVDEGYGRYKLIMGSPVEFEVEDSVVSTGIANP